jgi:hypothetical protein
MSGSYEDESERLIVLEHKVDNLTEGVSFIKQALIGEINDKPGLIVRLDRVEQKLALRDKVGWLLISAVVSTVMAQLWTFMR